MLNFNWTSDSVIRVLVEDTIHSRDSGIREFLSDGGTMADLHCRSTDLDPDSDLYIAMCHIEDCEEILVPLYCQWWLGRFGDYHEPENYQCRVLCHYMRQWPNDFIPLGNDAFSRVPSNTGIEWKGEDLIRDCLRNNRKPAEL